MQEELIRYIAKNLVNEPDAVKVSKRGSNRTVVYELNVASGDMGRVIGKSGRVANAIRSLLRVASEEKRGKRIILEIE